MQEMSAEEFGSSGDSQNMKEVFRQEVMNIKQWLANCSSNHNGSVFSALKWSWWNLLYIARQRTKWGNVNIIHEAVTLSGYILLRRDTFTVIQDKGAWVLYRDSKNTPRLNLYWAYLDKSDKAVILYLEPRARQNQQNPPTALKIKDCVTGLFCS